MSIVSKNVWLPFHYVADIVKDSVQLGLCVMVVNGFEGIYKNWLSFSSVVSQDCPCSPGSKKLRIWAFKCT